MEHFNCRGKELIQVGTLSKALGSLGGYVAGSKVLIDFLRNRAPSWIYTTALTPGDTAAALAAIKIVREEPERRAKLWENIISLKGLLKSSSLVPIVNFESPIICFEFKDAAAVLEAAKQLKKQGIFAPAIRPPTVNTSRIRISLMAAHELEHLERLVEAMNN